MSRVAIIAGSSRPGRKSAAVADWVLSTGHLHPVVTAGAMSLEVVDLAEVGLPLLDEPVPAAFANYQHAHTRDWAATVAGFDGFVFVTPEYNHSIPAVLKNAIDYLYAEWAHKPAGFVSYGLAGGVRAVEHLKLVLSEVQVAPTSSQVALSVFDDFTYTDPTDPTSPAAMSCRPHQTAGLHEVLDDVHASIGALAGRRTPTPTEP